MCHSSTALLPLPVLTDTIAFSAAQHSVPHMFGDALLHPPPLDAFPLPGLPARDSPLTSAFEPHLPAACAALPISPPRSPPQPMPVQIESKTTSFEPEPVVMDDPSYWPTLPQPAPARAEAPQVEQAPSPAALLPAPAIVMHPSPDGQGRLRQTSEPAVNGVRPVAPATSQRGPAVVTPLPGAEERARLRAQVAELRAEAARSHCGGPPKDAARRDAPAWPLPVPPRSRCPCTSNVQCVILSLVM